MPTVALIAIHGMGPTEVHYAEPVRGMLRSALGPLMASVDLHAVNYKHILQANEEAVWDRIDTRSKVHYDDLRKFLLFGFGDAAGLEARKEEEDSVYELAQLEVAQALWNALQQNGTVPVVFLTQSLGCQVLSNYIYDAQKAMQHWINESSPPAAVGVWRDLAKLGRRLAGRPLTPAERDFLACKTCSAWVSTGCNIPIFMAAHKAMTVKPIEPPTPSFKWLNLYDPDDVLGWPLQPLYDDVDARLVEDRAINAGQGAVNWILKSWNPLSHSTYWTDDNVVDPLADILRVLINQELA